MGLYLLNGSRIAKNALATTTPADPEVKLTGDVYEKRPLLHEYGPEHGAAAKTEGTLGPTLKWAAGTVVRQSAIDAAYPAATITAVTPAAGAAAGGTVVTITGTNLDGVTGVTFGGTAGTALAKDSPAQIRVTAPAKTAATYDVVVTDDSGTATATAAYTTS